MSRPLSPDEWQKANGAYLTAALAWLRLLLESQAREPAEKPSPWRGLFSRRNPSGELGKRASNSQPTRGGTEYLVEAAAQAMAGAQAMDPPPALFILSQRLGLSSFERDILLLCAAMELDTRLASLCARAQDDPGRPYPTFALALAVFDEPSWDALSPERPLRYWRLLEISQSGGQPLTNSPLRADERIVSYVKGLNYLDDRLSPLLVPFDLPPNAVDLPPSQAETAQVLARALAASAGQRAPIVQLLGADSLSKQLVARQALTRLNLQLLRLPVSNLPAHPAELETVARLWQRETQLLPLALYLDAHEGLEPAAAGEGERVALDRLLSHDLGLVLLDTREVQPGLGVASLPIDVARPTAAEQLQAWTQALGSDAGQSPARLAGQFNLNLPTIHQLAQAVLAEPVTEGASLHDRVWQACLLRTRPRLDKLAQRLEPKAKWADIVLPEEPLKLLRQIAAQVGQRSHVYDDWGFRQKMNRGLGISALFAGESGTGKTMAGEVIADELQLSLYRIDLSAVVSKYIGETEKNLRQVFDAADGGGVILFFDEADALFGKRSEVKDSHDRYANIEISYLLQRMEAYHGLAILASNMKSALDPAFLRRLRFIVTFPFPGLVERKLIWQKVFPAGTPTEALDYDVLARINLTGGSIHNTALNAAFLAAGAGTPVTMPLLLDAARGELLKMDKPVNEAEFRPPDAMRAHQELWQRLVAQKVGAAAVALTEKEYRRLSWLPLEDKAIARAVDVAAERAKKAGVPVTVGLLLEVLR
jgi:hypothetical protein